MLVYGGEVDEGTSEGVKSGIGGIGDANGKWLMGML